jgi:hypothetical protein
MPRYWCTCVCVCVCVRVRACVRACVCARAHAKVALVALLFSIHSILNLIEILGNCFDGMAERT